MRSVRKPLIACLALFVAMASDRLSAKDYFMADFPRFPNVLALDDPLSPKLGLSTDDWGRLNGFTKFLELFNKSQADFVAYCTGSRTAAIFATVKGESIVVWPDRLAECKKLATVVGGSDPDFRRAIASLNARFKASYVQPKTDDANLVAWSKAMGSGQSFGSACDDASRRIVFFGQPGIQTPPAEVLKSMKTTCPEKWLALFSEDADPKGAPKSVVASEGVDPGNAPPALAVRSKGLAESMFEDEVSNDSVFDKQTTKQRLDRQLKQAAAQQSASLANAVRAGIQGQTGKDLLLEQVSKAATGSPNEGNEQLDPLLDADATAGAKSKSECDTWYRSIEQKYLPQIAQVQTAGSNALQAGCKLAVINLAAAADAVPYFASCEPGKTATARSDYAKALAYKKQACSGSQ